MNATIKIRAVNGYIEPQRFDRLENENLQIKLEATYLGGFLLEWNGSVFQFINKMLTIPHELIKEENTIVVRCGDKRINCGKLFAKQIDTEMVEMLDIEQKYQADIKTLTDETAVLREQVLSALAKIQERQKTIEKAYTEILKGVDLFSEEE